MTYNKGIIEKLGKGNKFFEIMATVLGFVSSFIIIVLSVLMSFFSVIISDDDYYIDKTVVNILKIEELNEQNQLSHELQNEIHDLKKNTFKTFQSDENIGFYKSQHLNRNSEVLLEKVSFEIFKKEANVKEDAQ